MNRLKMAEEIRRRDRLIEASREDRDRLERAVRWALGEMVEGVESFAGRAPGEPTYWWRRRLRELAFGTKRRPA